MIRCAILYAPLLDVGGVENHLLQLFKASSQVNWLVFSKASPRFKQEVGPYSVEFFEWAPKSVWDIGALRRLVARLREVSATLIHVHSPEVSVLAKIAAMVLRLPLLMTNHLGPSEYFRGTTVTARLKKLVYLTLDSWLNFIRGTEIIFCSREVMTKEKRKFPYPAGRTHWVPNGIDAAGFSKELENRENYRQDFGLRQGSTVICFVGRDVEQKGLDVLLDAFKLTQNPGNVVLWVIGPDSAHFTEGTNPNVIFWGRREDIKRFLVAADIFTLPSRYEGMPIALMEAMATKLACVTTPVGENRSLIRHGENGLLVPVGDTKNLAKALSELVVDKSKRTRLGQQAFQTIKSFDVSVMTERTLATYSRMVSLRTFE
jgi:glycosyltransferase involved in cell wall biosynthesis